MIEQQYERFKDALWFNSEDRTTVLVGGAGGIGSYLTFFLSRAGFKPIVYDFDTVSESNLGGQLYRNIDVGSYKVEALNDIIINYCNDVITTFNEPITPESPTSSFVFSAFDNMKARKEMFESWKARVKDWQVLPIFIDGRMSMENIQIYCVTPNRIEDYEATLFSDEDVPDEPCTLRQTSHSAAMISTHMVSLFTNHISNIKLRKKVRDVPFFYEHYIPACLTNVTR